MDEHFRSAPFKQNLCLLLGLTSFYNTSIAGYPAKALLPYAQALCKFVPHIQLLDMVSNGKRVSLDGTVLNFECTGITFGEPGTNGNFFFI